MAIKPSLNNINNFVAPSNPANKTAGILLIVVAVVISAYISMVVWIEKRTLLEKLTYKPVTEEVAAERVAMLKTSQAVEMQVIYGSDERTMNVKAGTAIKILGVYMTKLNYRSDSHYSASPAYFTEDQYFFIELPNGIRGAAVLPELAGHWNEYSCLNNNGETVVYTCPLAGVPADKQHKVAGVPNIMRIPTHESDGFFLFPRYKSWNMFKMGFWWRGRFMLTVYWLILMIIVLWRLGAYSVRLSVKADRKFVENPSLSGTAVYDKIVRYYWSRYYPAAFVVGCVFSPLVWLWTKMNRSAAMSSLMKELGAERCPKCAKLALAWKYTGKETPWTFLRTVHTDQHTNTHYEDVKGEKVYDPDKDRVRDRQRIITTTYAAGSHDVYHRKKEYVVYCTKCNAVIRTDWEEESKTQNYKGGEILRESASLESVKYN